MLILVGLGNPGEKYARHRHNVGFMAVDAIADRHGFSPAREKFRGLIREGAFDTPAGRQKAMVLKPLTFMNESGRSVREAAQFFKVPSEDVIVFYDELDLAPGKVKIKTGGGAAGHNGIRSIDAHLGNDFQRVRIGIGHPGHKSKVSGYVLGNFAKADEVWLGDLLDAMAVTAPWLATDKPRFLSELALELNGESDAGRKRGASPNRANETRASSKPAGEKTKKADDKKTAAQAPPLNAPSQSSPAQKPKGALGEALSKLFGQNGQLKD